MTQILKHAIQGQMGDVKIPRFRFSCPHCSRLHRRNAWSIAHSQIDQTFDCPCGNRIALDPLPNQED